MSGGSVESRVATMKFENAAFERGVGTTMSTLAKLKESLNFSGGTKGLDNLANSANKTNFSGLGSAVDGISAKFLALSTIGITALATITSKAVNAGLTMAKSFAIKPITDGFSEYETKLTAIQTILANTAKEGTNLNDVSGALNDLNTYSDKTIYSFSEMVNSVKMFTTAGVKLKTSVGAIKGLSNIAAITGTNAQEAAGGMYQLSQAMSTGTVRLQDWMSVEKAGGMGGSIFKDSLIETAKVNGVNVDAMIKKNGSFRASLQEGWLSAKILTQTAAKFTGDLSKEQLKAQGYTEKQIVGIQKQAKTALDAATKVKTFTQLVGTVKESIGSGWAASFELIFGNINEAKELFTSINNVISGFITKSSEARNKLIGDWKDMGGRTYLIQGIKNAFQALMDIVKPIKDAFRDIFPAKTAGDLFLLTTKFAKFTESLKIGSETSENLKRTFKGVFALFDIAKQIIGGVIGVFTDLFGTVGKGTGGFLEFTGGIGDFLVSVDEALKKGGLLSGFFDGLSAILKVPLKLIQAIGGFIGSIFDGFDNGAANNVTDSLTPVVTVGERIRDAFSGLSKIFGRVGTALAPLGESIGKALGGIGDAISKAVSGINYDQVLATINTALFGGLILMIKRFFSKGVTVDAGGGMFASIKETFGQLTGTLKTMQQQVKVKMILEIAAAVALMTASVVALSMIDSDKLASALSAMAVGFGELLGGMAILVKISGSAGFVKVPAIAAAMVLLSTAVLILAGAVKIMSTMSWEELAKGLVGTAGALVIIAGAMRLMPKSLPLTASGLVLVGIGLASIAGAMKLMGMLSWEEIGKGLVGMAGALVIIAGAMNLMPLSMPITAAGLVLVGIGLTAIAGALKIVSKFSWEEIGKGLVGIGGALVLIAAAMNLMPLTLPITAAGLILVGIALAEIAGVAKIFASMSWEELAKAGVALAGTLLIIAGGLYLMSGTLAGSAALLVASAALAVLTPVLVKLGNMSWMSIAKGLIAIAGAFVIIGVAGLVLGPLSPVIVLLAGSLLAIGAGLALAGLGALAFATAVGILAAAGAAAAFAIGLILGAIIIAIPKAMKAFAEGIIAFAKTIATGGPAFTKAFVTVLTSLLDAVIKIAPKIGQALTTLIHTALNILLDNVPAMIEAGFKLIMALLRGIRDHIAEIVTVVASIIKRFIGALANELPGLLDAGAKLIIKFIEGLSTAIDDNAEALGKAGGKLAVSIITGMTKGIAAGAKAVADAAKKMAQGAIDSVIDLVKPGSPSKTFEKLGISVGQGFAKGLIGSQDLVKTSLDNMKALIKDTVDSTKADVKSAEDALKTLKSADKPDTKKINAAKKALAQATAEHGMAIKASATMSKTLKEEQKELVKLSKDYDAHVVSLKDANDELTRVTAVRDDAIKSITNTYSTLPAITADTTLSAYSDSITTAASDATKLKNTLDQLKGLGLDDPTYAKLLGEGASVQPFLDKLLEGGTEGILKLNTLNSTFAQTALNTYENTLRDEAAATVKFKQSLDAAKALGMDDTTYQKLLDEGVTAQPFLDELLASGASGIATLNGLNATLATAAAALGQKAGTDLHQAGVDSAQKLVNGLNSEQANIVSAMTDIAAFMKIAIQVDLHSTGVNAVNGLIKGLKDSKSALKAQMIKLAQGMVRAMQKELKAHSPSQVMMEIGKFANQGLAQGLDHYANVVDISAARVAKSALDTIRTTISGISDIAIGEMNTSPVIAPVIDLTQFRKDASQINDLVNANAIAANVSYDQASSISAAQTSAQTARSESVTETPPATVLQFEQNNYSPKSLSPVETYRQTKSLLSLAKEALNA